MPSWALAVNSFGRVKVGKLPNIWNGEINSFAHICEHSVSPRGSGFQVEVLEKVADRLLAGHRVCLEAGASVAGASRQGTLVIVKLTAAQDGEYLDITGSWRPAPFITFGVCAASEADAERLHKLILEEAGASFGAH